jgi:hypothetical protein
VRTTWRAALRQWCDPKAIIAVIATMSQQAGAQPAGPGAALEGAPGDAADLAATFAGPLMHRLAELEVAVLDEPHILVCTDPATGVTTYTGPYPNAYEAMLCLDELEAALRADVGLAGPTCTLAPLFPG